MKRSVHTQSGYILVLTLLITSILMVLVSQFFQQGQLQAVFDATVIEREQAKQLALGGLTLATSQLLPQEKKEEEKKTETKSETTKNNPAADFLKKIVPLLNRWQTIELKEDADDIDGTIQLCISCEDGKLDLNQLYDLPNKRFFGENTAGADAKKMFKTFFGLLRPHTNNQDLSESFAIFMKQRQYRLNDVTELLVDKEFQRIFGGRIFREPPTMASPTASTVYLTDIFTINGPRFINSWFLSDGMCIALGLKRADGKERLTEMQQILKNVTTLTGALSSIWDTTFLPLYGKEYKALPQDLTNIMVAQPSAPMFGILSYGTVGTMTQGIYAIVQRMQDRCKVVKQYWL